MNKEQLMRLAEHGVRVRLKEIQTELAELARDFPHLVLNQDGAMPAVMPVELKSKRGGARPRRLPKAERIKQVRAFLTQHPSATTNEVGAALGVVSSAANKILRDAGAKPTEKVVRGSRHPIRWKL